LFLDWVIPSHSQTDAPVKVLTPSRDVFLLMGRYEMPDENTTHQPYQTITHYKVSLTIPDDETTQVIIKTKSAGVCFATSPEDALQQTKTSNGYSQQSYASYILRYVRENLLTIDANDVILTYTQDPTIVPMTQKDLQDFQRDVVSANG
jgi:hypothetical protein